jgi:hypothetical protein
MLKYILSNRGVHNISDIYRIILFKYILIFIDNEYNIVSYVIYNVLLIYAIF